MRSGSHQLAIQYDGEDIKDSPFWVFAEAGAVDPRNVTVEGPGITSDAICGSLVSLIIRVKDTHDNAINRVIPDLKDKIFCSISAKEKEEKEQPKEVAEGQEKEASVAPEETCLFVTEGRDGSFIATYEATSAGE